MSELQNRLSKLVLRLDYMGMRCEQALQDALHALYKGDIEGGQAVNKNDAVIDREEVEIEQECIRLLALYQPAAIDLRMICTIIKVNSDLERIADMCASMGKRVKHVVADGISFNNYSEFEHLAQITIDTMGRTTRILSTFDMSTAKQIINDDELVDKGYRHLIEKVLDREGSARGEREGGVGGGVRGGVDAVMTMINLAKALERIGDHCTNIAEDVIFLRTGDIIRHGSAHSDQNM